MQKGVYYVLVKIEFNRKYEKEYEVTLAVYGEGAAEVALATGIERMRLGEIGVNNREEIEITRKRHKSLGKPSQSDESLELKAGKPTIRFNYGTNSNPQTPLPPLPPLPPVSPRNFQPSQQFQLPVSPRNFQPSQQFQPPQPLQPPQPPQPSQHVQIKNKKHGIRLVSISPLPPQNPNNSRLPQPPQPSPSQLVHLISQFDRIKQILKE